MLLSYDWGGGYVLPANTINRIGGSSASRCGGWETAGVSCKFVQLELGQLSDTRVAFYDMIY